MEVCIGCGLELGPGAADVCLACQRQADEFDSPGREEGGEEMPSGLWFEEDHALSLPW